jgi:uncharacterized membrane protein YgdD (TMEM256/DUF423 family)
MHPRTALVFAGVLGASGVILGAFGAHGLRGTLDAAGTREVWATASQYLLLHAAALAGLAGWMRASSGPASKRIGWAVRLWSAGILLFSGSLYLLALGGPRWLGAVTPLGGTALIAGWILAACGAFAP